MTRFFVALAMRLWNAVSVDFEEWHFNVRPSNTEPLLRLNLEALSQPLMESKRDEVLDVIRS
jgi:phosphomannomutase